MITRFSKSCLAILLTIAWVPISVAANDDTKSHDPVANIPVCDMQKVLTKISKEFSKKNIRFTASEVELTTIDNVQETAVIANSKLLNDRRFCEGLATLADGTQAPIFYLIQENDGLASIGWGVEYCVIGQDLEREHGANCRSLQAPL